MSLLIRLTLLVSVMVSALALSGCLVRSEPGYYRGNGYGGHPHGGPPGQNGNRGHGHGNGHGH